MTQSIKEVVVYRVNSSDDFDPIRTAAEIEVRKLPGWLGWSHMKSADDPARRVDVVTWQDAAAARMAGHEVNQADRFAPFRQAIAEVVSFGHYSDQASATALVQAGLGIEIGRFRLRAGEDEAAMKAAYRVMVDDFLSKQIGWVGQSLVALGDGVFADIALAIDQVHSQAICSSWAGNPLCEAFIALVECDDMAFGTVV